MTEPLPEEGVGARDASRPVGTPSSAAPSSESGKPMIVVGQRWRSKDKRDKGLVAKVLAYTGPQGHVTIRRYNTTKVRTDRFHECYELVVSDVR